MNGSYGSTVVLIHLSTRGRLSYFVFTIDENPDPVQSVVIPNSRVGRNNNDLEAKRKSEKKNEATNVSAKGLGVELHSLPSPESIFFHFYAVSVKIMSNNRLASPLSLALPWEILDLPLVSRIKWHNKMTSYCGVFGTELFSPRRPPHRLNFFMN